MVFTIKILQENSIKHTYIFGSDTSKEITINEKNNNENTTYVDEYIHGDDTIIDVKNKISNEIK